MAFRAIVGAVSVGLTGRVSGTLARLRSTSNDHAMAQREVLPCMPCIAIHDELRKPAHSTILTAQAMPCHACDALHKLPHPGMQTSMC